MFFRLFALFAVVAVAFANPNPKPQVLSYAAPGYVPAVGYSAYSPLAYSAYSSYPAAAALPYAYSGYYVR